MLEALRTISGHRKASTTFMTPDQLRRSDESEFMVFEEVIEMAYENMQSIAKQTIRNIRPIVELQEKDQARPQEPQQPLKDDSPF
jgi:hypothetical protein